LSVRIKHTEVKVVFDDVTFPVLYLLLLVFYSTRT